MASLTATETSHGRSRSGPWTLSSFFQATSQAVMDAVSSAVLFERHVPSYAGSHGITIYHPSKASQKLDHDYYRTPRGFHPRAVNSNGSWTLTTPLSFMNMPLLTYIAEISPRPVLLIHGEKAHSRYFSETAYAAAAEPKELLIIPGANPTDLYDRVDKIPFDRISEFFGQSLK